MLTNAISQANQTMRAQFLKKNDMIEAFVNMLVNRLRDLHQQGRENLLLFEVMNAIDKLLDLD